MSVHQGLGKVREKKQTANKNHFHTDSSRRKHCVTWVGSAPGTSSEGAIRKDLKERRWKPWRIQFQETGKLKSTKFTDWGVETPFANCGG